MYFNVTTLDIENRWRPLTDAEADVANVLLEDADRILYNNRPQLLTAINATDPDQQVDPGLVPPVLADMVIRVLGNPDSYRTTNVGADGSIGVGYFNPVEILRPRVALAPGDLDEIDRALRRVNQAQSVVKSRRMLNTDYGVRSLLPSTNTLPTP